MLSIAFVIIAALFALTNLAAELRMRRIRANSRSVIERVVSSEEITARIARDFDRERLLIDAHIFETHAAPMAVLDQQIARVQADLDAETRAYGTFAKADPAVRAAWHELSWRLEETRAPAARALAFSRLNQDYEARAEMVTLEAQYEAVSQALTNLVGEERVATWRAIDQATMVQRSTAELFVVLAVLGAGLTLVVGMIVMRIVRQSERASREYQRRLEMQNRELDAFAGRVAHDLRGPLTSMGLAAERLASKAPKESATYSTLRRSLVRMSDLIDDLLALSRIDSEAAGGVCDPSEIAAQVRDEMASRLTSESVDLEVTMESAMVRCRDQFLREAVSNLVENAVKYHRSDVKPAVSLRGRVVERHYEFRVADNGIGMSVDETRAVFAPFYRSPRVHAIPGTGLGLSIVKRVIEASGGTIAVDSEIGRGSTFVIRLPLSSNEDRPRRER